MYPKICINVSNIINEIFRTESPLEIWENIKNKVSSLFKIKTGYTLSSFKTDSIGCSLLFKSKTKKKKVDKNDSSHQEKYFDDLESYEEFKGQTIVAIDPNKGNLMYCYDGKNTLKYTQNDRRKATKKTKYKQIRKSIETCDLIKSRDKLSEYNSRTVFFTLFKEFITHKNKDSYAFMDIWRKSIHRKLNFNTKINTKRSEALFCNKFKDTFGDNNSVTVVFGDWEQKKGMSFGKEPTKGKGCRKMLRDSGYNVYLKDEYRTSKVCSYCHSECFTESSWLKRKDPRPWKKDQIQSVWGLLRCKNVNCSKVHNRDMNSSTNMYELAWRMIRGVEIPHVFHRKIIPPVLPDDLDQKEGLAGNPKILKF